MKWRKLISVPTVAIAVWCGAFVSEKKQNILAPWILPIDGHSSVKWDANWDGRHGISTKVRNTTETQDTSAKRSPRVRRHIFLVRHGQYKVQGRTDLEQSLTSLGERQADLAGKRLQEYGYTYTRLVSSSMTRAKDTARIIKETINAIRTVETDLLTEGAPIKPEPTVDGWNPDIDPFYQDSVRIEAAFRHFIHRPDTTQTEDTYEILVCHANVIRALQLPPEAWLRMSLNHGSITWLTVLNTGDVVLKQYGDTGFMPIEDCTTYNFPEDVWE
ncbi:serine/threonine-protein phosphatase PGAM5 [Mytilus galloprovincialis]|uniref:Serine/threonine-protein phosphatase PGAM5, mitochondrial n=1 Tax=Mytilus galloprovincialis TaxID=29158 RepID=A0A8B6HT80_MYTGA|nr:serine/threonine-protein phosphatase PGAM5 [Mytilus galloprovincialis]